MTNIFSKRCIILVLLVVIAAPFSCASEGGPTFFAWRSLGYHSNAMHHIRVKCFLGSDGTPNVGETGQARQGWHELHPAAGCQTASFSDKEDSYPTIAGPVMARTESGTFFDIPIYWVYEADNCVWGQSFKELGQTFVATGDELDKVSCLVVTPRDTFDVFVHKGGPSGEQVGPTRTLVSGHSMEWGIARWLPGEVPLEVGEKYYIGMRGRSGKPFTTYLHSTGDAYSGGCAYYDGVPEPGTDLALFISLQRDDTIRSPVLFADEDGWVKHARGVYFTARSANIRAMYSHIRFKDTPFHIDAFFRVYRLMPDGQLVRAGEDKKCYNYAKPGSEHYTAVLYAADDIPLEVGKTYYVEVVPRDETLPTDESKLPKRNLLVRIYGEKTPGMTPVIFNQKIVETTSDSIKLAWEGSKGCTTRIRYGVNPYDLDRVLEVRKGRQEATLSSLGPAMTVNFRFVLTTREGGRFETPVYQARTLGVGGNVIADPPLLPTPGQPEYARWTGEDPPPGGFLNLAVMDRRLQPPLPKVKALREVPTENAGFEHGLDGWQTAADGRVKRSSISHEGTSAAGWDIEFTENVGNQSFAQEVVYQQVRVKPGRSYMLSAWLYTDQEGDSPNEPIQAGDTRVRLICDPRGGTDFLGRNSTQGFSTGGKWMQFGKVWKAESDTVTIGVGFFRWRDWSRVTALADGIRLVEVKG